MATPTENLPPPPVEKPPVVIEADRTTAQPVTAADLVDPLASAMPAPTAATDSPAPPPVAPKDTRGTLFDPERHATRDDGSPAKNRHGRFYSKEVGKRGANIKRTVNIPVPPRRPDPTFANVTPGVTPPPATESTPLEILPPGEDQYTILADLYLQISYGPLMALFSEGIRPIPEEHIMLKQSLAAWLRSMKAKEFSPGVAFALCAGGIFMAKLEKPTVREKAQLLWVRAKQLWAKWTGKKEGDK